MRKDFALGNEMIEKLREVIDLPEGVISLKLDIPARNENRLPEVTCTFHPTLSDAAQFEKITGIRVLRV